MVFSSSIFLFIFLPIVLLLYYLSPKKIKNYTLLFFSLLFYTWGAVDFILIALLSMLADYYIALRITMGNQNHRKRWLFVSIAINVSLLLYFKYANFFIENVNELLGIFGCQPYKWVSIVLPIGISFLTFQKMSYVIDVYRKTTPSQKNFAYYALYILMFPQLIAGPIVRYKDIQTQLDTREEENSFSNRIVGFIRFMIGLSKKVLIANVLSEQADIIFAVSPDYFSTGTAWIGILAYTFQIYFDFAGYSDMAIGLGKMFGFEFLENFNFPYISKSITEFWRRWHISLSNWMKDYLYISLGGNRVKVSRMYLNLIIVFLISGLWHGADWTFVVWGAYHGIFIMADKLFLLKVLKKIGRIPSTIFTFFVVIIGWVFFRSDSINYAFSFIKKMFLFDNRIDEFSFNTKFIVILIAAILFSFMGIWKKLENLQFKLFDRNMPMPRLAGLLILAVVLYLLCGGALLAGAANPFIYFRF